jgi:FkbH-like protein
MPHDHNPAALRIEADRLLAEGSFQSASMRLSELWRREPGSATASFISARMDQLRDKLQFTTLKFAILRSFTVEPIVPILRAEASTYGIDLDIHVGDFNTYVQDLVDSSSSLYKFAPDAVALAVRTSDVAPELSLQFADLSQYAAHQAADRVAKRFDEWVRALRRHSQAALILHSLERPSRTAFGVLDGQSEDGQSGLIRHINSELRQIAATHRGVYVLDYDALVARYGIEHWHDERKWVMVRMPISAAHLLPMAREWMRFLMPLSGRIAKAIAVDLDNTLWGGIIGEDGMTGIKISPEHPGAAYQALQRALLDLSRRGILLAICSKNNLDDAMEALDKHPGMLLRPKDFAAMRINWGDKSQSLREIAQELNIGLDALAFLDDNPFEREQVRAALPEVTVIDISQNPSDYAAIVRDCPVFERLTLSAEDQQRTVMYAEQRQRADAEQGFQSKEDFFRFLEQEAELNPVTDLNLARIAQLTQKTNQFNLTTRRYSEAQIAEMSKQPGWNLLSIRVRDRFGDHGLVGVAIAHDNGEQCELDTFLLSCRVIGRTVETALLAHIAKSASERGCKQLTGWFLPTKKNAPARDFYRQHEFNLVEENEKGSLWSLDLTRQQVAFPDWVKLVSPNGGHADGRDVDGGYK